MAIWTTLGKPTSIALDRGLWEAAAVLGGLRKATNESIRSRERDRGARGNMLNDLEGAVSELAALKHITGILPSGARVAHRLLSLAGPVDESDMELIGPELGIRLEVKGLLAEDRKKRFLINCRAFERSKERGANGYLPLITSSGASTAYVGSVVDMREVEAWRVEDLGYGDPARSVPLGEFAAAHMGVAEDEMRRSLRRSEGSAARWNGDLARLFVKAEAALCDLKRKGFSIDGMPLEQLVASLRAAV